MITTSSFRARIAYMHPWTCPQGGAARVRPSARIITFAVVGETDVPGRTSEGVVDPFDSRPVFEL